MRNLFAVFSKRNIDITRTRPSVQGEQGRAITEYTLHSRNI